MELDFEREKRKFVNDKELLKASVSHEAAMYKTEMFRSFQEAGTYFEEEFVNTAIKLLKISTTEKKSEEELKLEVQMWNMYLLANNHCYFVTRHCDSCGNFIRPMETVYMLSDINYCSKCMTDERKKQHSKAPPSYCRWELSYMSHREFESNLRYWMDDAWNIRSKIVEEIRSLSKSEDLVINEFTSPFYEKYKDKLLGNVLRMMHLLPSMDSELCSKDDLMREKCSLCNMPEE